jgi:Domain of unknown function (DUF1998)
MLMRCVAYQYFPDKFKMSIIKIRRPQLTDAFGIGSIFDAPGMSLMISETNWDSSKLMEVEEPRLVRRLRVDRLLTPVPADDEFSTSPSVPARRFPNWAYCPNCNVLQKLADFGPIQNVKKCPARLCSDQQLLPSRIVVACKAGHIDDFPWFKWAHTHKTCTVPEGRGRLKLVSANNSTSFSDMSVTCQCGASRDLGDVLMPRALSSIDMHTCQGGTPWRVGGEKEECAQEVKVLQRGATNVYFPIRESAVSIPPYSGHVHMVANTLWSTFKTIDPSSALWKLNLEHQAPLHGVTPEELSEALRNKKAEVSGQEADIDIKLDEFSALSRPPRSGSFRDQFLAEVVSQLPPKHTQWLQSVTLVKRLRMVTAQVGFSRIEYPMDDTLIRSLNLQVDGKAWLPANEVRGEGIFIQLNPAYMTNWVSENKDALDKRLKYVVQKASRSRIIQRTELQAGAELIVLHTLSHLLINELAMESGYSATSIRERLYSLDGVEGGPRRLGILIYTSSSDSEGSLGGLVRQGSTERLAELLDKVIESSRWCSNDPLCAETPPEQGQGVDGMNLAACHCCGLLPETSCELFNALLDRTLLSGGHGIKGFIS